MVTPTPDRAPEGTGFTRGELVRRTVATSAALGLMPAATAQALSRSTRRTRAAADELTIVQWEHVVPGYDSWFNAWAESWGASRGVNVRVDHVEYTDLPRLAAAEAKAEKGHDIFGFLAPPAGYEDKVIDHADVVAEVERMVGPTGDHGRASTWNPRTGKYFGVSDGYAPAPLIWRHDLWNQVGESPATWDHVLAAAPKLSALGHTIGIGLADEPDSTVALLGLMACFGSFLQDEGNHPTLGTKATIEAVDTMKELFAAGGDPRTLAWGVTSNNQSLLGGKAALIVNAISATRTADALGLPLARELWLWPLPRGPRGRLGAAQYTSVYSIWSFAKHRELAEQFLADFCADYEKAVSASKLFMFPSFPGAMPPERLYALAAKDPSLPHGKYSLLTTIARKHTIWNGYPGTANAAVEEALRRAVVPQMFRRVIKGEMSAAESVRAASGQQRRIWRRAHAAGRV